MNPSRIQMSHPYGATPPNTADDFDWVRRHEQALLAQYGESSIIVYQQQVIGVGKTYDDALADAENHLPPDSAPISPIHERLRHRHPFLRVHIDPGHPAPIEQPNA